MNPKVRPVFWVLLGGAVLLAWAVSRKKAPAPPAIPPPVPESGDVPREIVQSLGDATNQTYIVRKLFGAVSTELPDLSFKAREIIVAHALLESGWNVGKPARNANNWWNIVAGTQWTGGVYTVVNGDRSYTKITCTRQNRPMDRKDSGGRAYCVIDQNWRRYPTVNAAVQDYWALLGKPDYRPARDALERGDVTAFASLLRQGGYYDGPLADYTKTLRDLVSSVDRRLY